VAQIYPILSAATGRTVAACNQEQNATMLADKVNKVAGEQRVEVGDPIPFNPRHDDELIAMLLESAL
jgi:hypothetical protein